jgi:hypothetical protein
MSGSWDFGSSKASGIFGIQYLELDIKTCMILEPKWMRVVDL